MIDRRRFVSASAGVLVAAALDGTAQQPEKLYRVGILTLGTDPTRSGFWQKFLEAMRELKYVEGRNLNLRFAFADGDTDRLPDLAADLVQAKVDVIVVTSTLETLAAKRATSHIPIVMTVVPDPVGEGLVSGLARPGGNVTGLTSVVQGLSEKYVELLHEFVPSVARFVVVGGHAGPYSRILDEVQASAQKVGIALSLIEIQASDDIDPAFARAEKDGAGGIIAPLGAVTYRYRAQLVQLALKHRLPGIYWHRDFVEAGGLMSYGANSREIGQRAAYFVDKILRGSKPADLPIEQPTKFELVINLKTAKALGLTVPQPLLVRADEVIQ